MYENLYGSSPDHTKGAQNVAGRLSVEPEDCVSSGDHNECLKNTEEAWLKCTQMDKNTHWIWWLPSDQRPEMIP